MALILYSYLVTTHASLNRPATRHLERFLERQPFRHPRVIHRWLARLDESATLEIINHETREWRRNWRRNIARFRRLPDPLTALLEEEFDRSPLINQRRARALSVQFEAAGQRISIGDVYTWFKTMQVERSVRDYARAIRRRIQMQIENEARASLYPPLRHDDPFLSIFDSLAFDLTIGL